MVALIAESEEKIDSELESEIFDALSEFPAKIPWMKKLLQVKVVSD